MKHEDVVEIEMLFDYPLLDKIVQTDDDVFYTGIITLDDEDYNISVRECPARTFSFELPPQLVPFQDAIDTKLSDKKPKTITEFLTVFKDVIKGNTSPTMPRNRCQQYRHVIRELSELTKFYLELKFWHTESSLDQLRFSIRDERNREHVFEVGVNYDCGAIKFEVVNFKLPLEKESFKISHTLIEIYEQFKDYVEKLLPFFDLMDTLDRHCWILEPVPPERSFTYRRICIGDNMSMVLKVDPFNVTDLPNITFLGPENLSDCFRTSVNGNLENWDPKNDVIVEILHLIGLKEFPQKKTTDQQSNDLLVEYGECNICFSETLNGKLPEVVCKNERCKNLYHTECLFEWLMSINSRRFFQEIIGQCPNCDKTITCPIP